MQRLLHRLIDHLGVQTQHGADAGSHRRPEMGDVVNLVGVQADRLHEVDLDFIAGGQTTDQLRAGFAGLLGHRENRWNVVAGMAVFSGEEGVVIVKFTHRRAVRPSGPFGMHAHIRTKAEHGRTTSARMGERHRTGGDHRMTVDGGNGHRGVVDHAVDDHVHHIGIQRHRISGDGSDLPCQLVFTGEAVALGMNFDVVQDHVPGPLFIVNATCSSPAMQSNPIDNVRR